MEMVDVHVHATKTMGSGDTTALIHNLSMIWRLGGQLHASAGLALGEEPLEPIKEVAG
jgi:hypothetical protein